MCSSDLYGLSPDASAEGFAKAQALAEQINQAGMINVKILEIGRASCRERV